MKLTIHNARHDKTLELVNIQIVDGAVSMLPRSDLAPGEIAIDARGAIVSPALIEPHFHLEKSVLPEFVNNSGTLDEAILIAETIKTQLTSDYIAHAAHLSSSRQILDAFDMPRYRAAKSLRVNDYGLSVGSKANLVLFHAASAADALRRQPDREFVIHNGQVLVQSERITRLSPMLPFAMESKVLHQPIQIL